MSTTLSIACRTCRKHLWIAQRSDDRGHVYGSVGHLSALYAFLSEHEGHELVFGDNCAGYIAEMVEIEVPASFGAGLIPSFTNERPIGNDLPLSPQAQHANETVLFALSVGDPTLTAAEVRRMIDRLYGPEIAGELAAYVGWFHRSANPNPTSKA